MGHLPIQTKLGYGAAELGVLAVETMARLHVLKFYTDVVGLRPGLAGLAAAIAIGWDAFADLFIGLTSDRTRTRLGRRRPYILAGGVALAATIAVLFHPPETHSQPLMAAALVAAFVAMNTAVSLLSVPHTALASDLTTDPHERTTLFGYRLFLGNLGLLAGALLPAWALSHASDGRMTARAAYSLASLGIGALVLVTSLTSFVATRGRDTAPPERGAMSVAVLLRSSRHVLGDRVFAPLLFAYVIAQVGIAINGTFALYYYQYRLELSSSDWSLVLAVFVTSWSVSIPLWVLASRRFAKRWLAFGGVIALGFATGIIYQICPPHRLGLPLVIAVLGGSLSGSIVLLESLVADIVDVDALFSRKKREGLYFGVWRMSAKIARGIAVAGSGATLGFIGFRPNEDQTPLVRERIALVFGPGVGACFVVAALLFLCMPLREETHRRVVRALRRRRDIEAARGDLA